MKQRVATKRIDGRNQRLGKLGESIAEQFYLSKGYTIVAKNLRNKIGELDLVVKLEGIFYIVEVKTLKYYSVPEFDASVNHETFSEGVARETLGGAIIIDRHDTNMPIINDFDIGAQDGAWRRPEMNLTKQKINKVKSLACYFAIKNRIDMSYIRIHALCVRLLVSKDGGLKINRCRVRVIPIY